jgi:hypothetical protein
MWWHWKKNYIYNCNQRYLMILKHSILKIIPITCVGIIYGHENQIPYNVLDRTCSVYNARSILHIELVLSSTESCPLLSSTLCFRYLQGLLNFSGVPRFNENLVLCLLFLTYQEDKGNFKSFCMLQVDWLAGNEATKLPPRVHLGLNP